MAKFTLNSEAFDRLATTLASYEGNAEQKINEVLWNEGGDLIEEKIKLLLPVSGRNWRGKKKAAKFAEPFMRGKANLAVVVKTKSAYNYLYFPDDGTNTRKHVGEQYFMHGGAIDAQDEVIDRCIAKLTEL